MNSRNTAYIFWILIYFSAVVQRSEHVQTPKSEGASEGRWRMLRFWAFVFHVASEEFSRILIAQKNGLLGLDSRSWGRSEGGGVLGDKLTSTSYPIAVKICKNDDLHTCRLSKLIQIIFLWCPWILCSTKEIASFLLDSVAGILSAV